VGALAAVLAAAVLLAALTATAVALNFLGLRDLLLPQKGEVNVIDPATGVVVPGQTHEVDTVSLSGYMDAPESKALAEWQAFLDGYDPDGSILASVGNYLDPALDQYLCYDVYTGDMADRLEEIAARYGLKLHRRRIDLYAHPEALGPLAGFARDKKETYWTYLYEDGSCHFDGYAYVEDYGLVNVQFQRSVKGCFNDVTLNVGDAASYEQWNYKTSSGVEVLLALGPDKSLIFADLPDCFAAFNVFQGTESEMTKARLEAVAERYDFSTLSPVEPPAALPEPDISIPVGERTDARAVYAQVLRDLLYNGVLPNGRAVGAEWSGDLSRDQFAVWDVDLDGRDELVVLHTADIMAGMDGFVLEFDPAYTGTDSPICFELDGFPAFAFYENGAVKVNWSHNQTWGELWPYELFTYDADTDRYTDAATVYAADRDLMEQAGRGEEYPDDVDVSGTGRVYYVNLARSSGGEPAGARIWDSKEYDAWLDSVLGQARELELPYQALTEENIANLCPP